MRSVGRLLQLIGLTIPPLAILAQLTLAITVKQLLGFGVAAVLIFGVGWLLQTYSKS